MKQGINRASLGVALAGAMALSAGAFGEDAFVTVRPNMNQVLAKAQLVSHASPSLILHVNVCLKTPSPDALNSFVDAVSNPSSPIYRQFLTPEQIGARFGQPAGVVQSVTNYLRAEGLTVKLVAKSNLNIMADGTVEQVEKAFNTTINQYRNLDPKSAGRSSFYAYSGGIQAPSSWASQVKTITGLQNFVQPKRRLISVAQAQTLYGTAKEFAAGMYGQGRTIAYSNWDGFSVSNLNAYYSFFNLPAPTGGVGSNVTIETIDGGSQSGSAQGEGDLDMQMILSMAPVCNLIVYDGGGGDTDVLTKEQDDNKADVISESYGWGDPSDVQDANHQIHALMSAEGITYLCASGDEGAGELTQVPYPDDDPDILVVGGTMATTDSTGNRTSEVVWNNNYTAWGIAPPWGTGTGGYSVDPAQCNTGLPAYQKLGTKGVPTNILHRLIPDIAANAGGPGTDSTQIAAFVEFIGGNEYISAGTSCASPLMAGGFGIAEQKLISLGALSADSHGHYRFGRINDLLYSQNQRSDVWFDVVSGTSGQMPNGNQAQAGVGWDFASGLGAINFDAFVNTMLLKLSLSPASVIAGKTTTGTVTLSSAAPTGGTVVTLSSSSANATVPASITVAAGSTSGTFTVTTKAGSPSYSSIIKATANGATQTATLYVSANGLTAFTLNPTTVTGGKTSTGTLTIGNPAPAGGWAVKLTSSDSSQVTVPASVTVAAGATTATFTATTVTYTADYASTITASDASSTKTATLQVLGNSVTGLTLNPTSVIGGTPVTGTVTIASPAPTGGYAVKLAPSNSAYATVPATVTVAAGAKTATFTVTTLATGSTVSVTITASDAVSSKTATLSVMGDKITSVIVTPNNAKSGTSVTGKVTLSSAAPSVGWVVKLTSSSTAASVPSSITVPSGATAANFTVTSTPQSSTITVTITASDILTSKTASLKLGGDSISSLALSPSTVPGGASSTGTVTLTSAAPTGGWLVNLSSSNSAVTVPVSVTVAAGATTATFTATTKVTGGSYTSTIKASDALSSKTATLTVTGGTLASLSFSPNNLVGGQQTTGTVKLTTPAPTGGVVVTLSSGSSLAQVPGTVTVQAGSITAIFVVQTSPSSSNALVTVTASDSANSVSATIGIES